MYSLITDVIEMIVGATTADTPLRGPACVMRVLPAALELSGVSPQMTRARGCAIHAAAVPPAAGGMVSI